MLFGDPYVSISLSGKTSREDALRNCIRLVQSYVLSRGYNYRRFFTGQTMDAVRAAVDQSGVFFVCSEIDLWKGFVGPTYTSFVSVQRDLCSSLLLQRPREYEIHYIECIKVNRLARIEQSARAAGSRGDTGCLKQGSSKSVCGKAAGNDTVVAVGSKKDKPKGETAVVKKKRGASTTKSSAKGKNVVDPDPNVFHKISKPSKR